VLVAELSGSESILHFDLDGRTWISQSQGIHPFAVGSTARVAQSGGLANSLGLRSGVQEVVRAGCNTPRRVIAWQC